MKNSHAIYWYLFWGYSIESLNDKVTEAWRKRDFEEVKFFCKVIAMKQMDLPLDSFWNKYVLRKQN